MWGPALLRVHAGYWDAIFSSCYDFLPQEKRFFRRSRYFPTVDIVDKHSLEKVGYALLAIV